MITYIYADEYCDEPAIVTAITTSSHTVSPMELGFPPAITLNAKLYIAGDKYDIWGLQVLAAKKYKNALSKEIRSVDFIESLKLIYEQTPESDRLLKDIAIEYAAKGCKALIEKEEFKELCGEHGDIAFDIMRTAEYANSLTHTVLTAPECPKCVSDYSVSVTSKAQNERFSLSGRACGRYFCSSCNFSFE